MAPLTPITTKNQRKRLSNAEKQKIIEESKSQDFVGKKLWKNMEQDVLLSVTY